jgi:hypothetical protein
MLKIHPTASQDEVTPSSNIVPFTVPFTQGRTEGTKNVPPMVRELAGKLSVIDGPSVVAEVFDISVSRASDYSNGKVTGEDKELDASIRGFVEKAQNQAAEKLLIAIGAVSEDEIKSAPLKTKLDVVDRFSRVVRNLAPKEDGPMIKDSNVIIYRPEMRKETDYEVINV